MSLLGKFFLFTSGFGLGFGAGVYIAEPTIVNEGDKIHNEVSGKVKQGSSINFEDVSQETQKEIDVEQNKKKKTRKKIFGKNE